MPCLYFSHLALCIRAACDFLAKLYLQMSCISLTPVQVLLHLVVPFFLLPNQSIHATGTSQKLSLYKTHLDLALHQLLHKIHSKVCGSFVGQEHALQLQDIEIILAASPSASQAAAGAAAASHPLAAGHFQLSNRQQSTPQAAHPHPLATPLAHHWSWSGSTAASALQMVPITTKTSSRRPEAAESGQGGGSERLLHPSVHLYVCQFHPPFPFTSIR